MSRGEAHEGRALALALLASLVLWNLPYGGLVLYPFKLLATWLHELSHGLVMIATGCGFNYVIIYRDTSGLAYSNAPMAAWAIPFIAAAGYMGTPLWGALILWLTPTARRSRILLGGLGGLLLLSSFTVIAIDEDAFGPWAIGAIGAALVAVAIFVPERWRRPLVHFLAAQACINAVLDIRVLLRPSQIVGGSTTASSDASNMAYSTFGTTADWAVWTWAAIWLAWSFAVLFVALRFSEWPASRRGSSDAGPTEAPRDGSDRDARRRSPATAPGETGPSAPADTEAP